MTQMFKYVIDYFDSIKRYNQAYKELNSLSDRELKDLGITRNDILFVLNESFYNENRYKYF